MNELKSCPFCRGAAVIHKCLDRCACNNNSCWIYHIYMSFDDWNTRTDTAALKRVRDALAAYRHGSAVKHPQIHDDGDAALTELDKMIGDRK